MVRSKSKSILSSKLGAKFNKAFEGHKNDSTKLGTGGDLPPNVRGIAKLVDIKFDTYKSGKMEGELYFLAAGTVVKPSEDADGLPILGLRTQIMEPMCDTPERQRATVEDHLSYVLNELRKLGLDTSELDADDLEEACKALVEEGVHFSFRTWAGKATKKYPNPQTNHDWIKAVNFDSADIEDEVVEEDDDETSEEEEEEEVVTEADEVVADEEDVQALATQADDGDGDAVEKLTELALAAGIAEEVIENADDWVSVANLFDNPEAEEAGEERGYNLLELGDLADDEDADAIDELTQRAETAELDPEEYETWTDLATELNSLEDGEEEEPYVPVKADVVGFKPKGKRKAVECSVSAVFAGKKTCNLKNLETNAIYKGVPFSSLIAGDVPF